MVGSVNNMGPAFHAALAFLVLSGTSSASSRSITQLPKLPELPKPFKTWYLHPVYTLGSRGSVPVNTSLWPLEHTFLQEEWPAVRRSEEHTSELQSLMRTSYAVSCLKKKTNKTQHT